MTAQLDDIPFVEVTVRPESLQDDLFQVAQAISPTVRREQVTFEELQGGYVNLIYKLSGLEVSPGVKKSLIFRIFDFKFKSNDLMKLYAKPKSKSENDAAVIAKADGMSNGHKKENGVNGENGLSNGHKVDANGDGHKKVDKNGLSNGHKNGDAGKANDVNEEANKEKPPAFFSRLTEYLVMNEVSKYGLCQPVYAKFHNGLCYGYTEGTTVTGQLMLSDEYLEEAASKFARFHSIKFKIPNLPFKARHDRISEELQENFNENILKFEEKIAAIEGSPFLEMPGLSVLIEYQKRITRTQKQIGLGKIVFSHNDPNQKNLIWNSKAAPGEKLGFIDMEMTMPNYQIFDLAYNFRFFGGHFLTDYDGSLFPSDEYRRRFLRRYLQEYNKFEQIELSAEEFDSQLEDLFHRVSLAATGYILRSVIFFQVIEVEKDMLKNAESIAAREKDRHFVAKHALKWYELFVQLYPRVLDNALEHFKATARMPEAFRNSVIGADSEPNYYEPYYYEPYCSAIIWMGK